MNIDTERFNARELCSRKLWQLVSAPSRQQQADETALQEAIAELSIRRHYLAQLQESGILGDQNADA
jgi:hypothetical protein